MSDATQILKRSDYIEKPWKNGRGSALQIARGKSKFTTTQLDESWEGADWNLNLAPVMADTTYSCFPGFSRQLTVVKGNGLQLTVDGNSMHGLHRKYIVAEPLGPVQFEGDVPCESFLIDGPVENLNLLYRRDAVKAVAVVVSGQAVLPVVIGGNAAIATLVYVIEGFASLKLERPTSATSSHSAVSQYNLNKGDTLLHEWCGSGECIGTARVAFSQGPGAVIVIDVLSREVPELPKNITKPTRRLSASKL
eukprot:gnl/MRDRNA2_/MRDRNA2_74782_c0_seq2.p1 gnl/MRDRNA2_/MRDRNA2_74782_c0~~gnl/MRDRNA2_/MRDRNA2_74782_c0_seq2.p1  ORF type:complete len:251 (+),score=28.14 gnl/MRDRNA2_/MRDRNA2_74782_c0_seq2:117-869(+)